MWYCSVDLPDSWLSLFEGTELEGKLHVSALLATADEIGRPHLAFLSAGEILARHPHRIGLALWPKSQTTGNFRRVGYANLYGVADGAVWEARLKLERDVTGEWAFFDTDVVDLKRHAASYADVTALINFKLHDPGATVDRWRKQIAMLREFTMNAT